MFVLGTKSKQNLVGVHPTLNNLVVNAIGISTQDFGVYEGIRTIEKERENIKNGTSKLSNPADCTHCVQKDGFGHAVDLVPYINGSFQWDWEGCYKIARAMQAEAIRFGTAIRWGGVWDKTLNFISVDMEKEVDLYKARHTGADFLDGVHFELVR